MALPQTLQDSGILSSSGRQVVLRPVVKKERGNQGALPLTNLSQLAAAIALLMPTPPTAAVRREDSTMAGDRKTPGIDYR